MVGKELCKLGLKRLLLLKNETRRDEVMPDLGDIGQMLGLEVDGMALIVEFPLTPPIC